MCVPRAPQIVDLDCGNKVIVVRLAQRFESHELVPQGNSIAKIHTLSLTA